MLGYKSLFLYIFCLFTLTETAEYKSEDAEFKVATAFTHYRFGFPEDIEDAKYQEHILIISVMEKERFLNKEYKMEEFGNYMVLY